MAKKKVRKKAVTSQRQPRKNKPVKTGRTPDDVSGTITNSIGMKLVPIPAGTFMMGSPKKEKDHGDDEVQHEVTITKDFYLGMTQVTQAQYKKVMGKNPSCFKGKVVSGEESSEFPVEEVYWYDAVKFCEKLSALPEEKAAGREYRLPTEAEWEYACRAGSEAAFSFGDDEESLGDYAWYEDNSCDRPHPVALKKPNAWGLYDMHGNVWEWCSDRYGGYPKGAVSDPVGKRGSNFLLRGGGWGRVACDADRVTAAASCRSAFRFPVSSSCKFDGSGGFRLALSSPDIPK